MTKALGHSLSLSPFRKLVVDLLHFSQQVPAVTAERHMDLGALVAARQASATRPRWSVLFAKAYALVCRDYPALRRCYLKCPWPRLYEHPHTIAALNVERRLPAEDIVLFCLIRSPENRSLEELGAVVGRHKDGPVADVRAYRRAVAMSGVPWPLRRWCWWAALNASGRRRCHNFGTFSLSSVASQGAGLSHLLPVLTSALHYGLLDERGRIEVRVTWDHRVTDGGTIARALVDLEAALNREIVRELAPSCRRAA